MFYVVQLDSNIFKEKIVVPSIWLDKYDTHCLLPPITDVVDVETLVKAQSTPKHGWQMHRVSSIQSFDTYSQARENITKGMISFEEDQEKQCHEEVRGKRKRKLPRFLEQYSIESYGSDESGCSLTPNCSIEDNVVLNPLIVKTERMEDSNESESHQQPLLKTTHNESSSSVHSSSQHDSQLQVAGCSSSTISSLKEDVKMFVQYALPNLNDSKLTRVTDTIIAEEPSELKDLLYFKEDDFLPILTKIQARKLMDFIQKSFSTGKRRAEIVEICRKSMEEKKVPTRHALAIEKSVNTAESEDEQSNVSQLSSFDENWAICRKSVEVEKVSTQQAMEIEKSVSTAESEAEPSNAHQLSSLDENWANDFEIPYEKFPPRVLRHCREGTRPSPQERKHVIRILAYEIFTLCKKPGKKNLEIIASKLLKQYPKSFQEVIGDEPFMNGSASILHSLIKKFDNMNRKKKSSLVGNLPETQKKAKKRCINFQPDDLSNEEIKNLQTEKQKGLERHFLRQYQNESEVDKTMSVTFASQIEKSVNTAESNAEPSTVPQLSSFVENWANDFEIPYEKFPPNVLKLCKEGLRPNTDERNHVIRILAYEIFKLCKRPGKKNMEIIVFKLIKQYPKSFQDVIGDQQFGNGYASFLHSLKQRLDNMNRTKKSSLIAKLPETQKKAKKRCINFQRDNLPHDETENSQTEKQKWLQMHFFEQYQNEEEVDKAMSMTFASQRLTINTVDDIEEIIKEWPYLMLTKYLLMHFNTAMQPYQPDWDCIFQKKIPELLRFLRSNITAVATSECSSIAVLQLLCLYFKEVNTIVQIYEDCSSLEIINKDTCPLTPFIAVFGTKSAVVFIETENFSQYVTPDDAFKMWFASYFVFNLVYPKECQATMHFIQRGLMGIPPDSSCNKQAMNKCIKLVKELSNSKNSWTIEQ